MNTQESSEKTVDRDSDQWKKIQRDTKSYFGKNQHVLEEEYKEELRAGDVTFDELLEKESASMADALLAMKKRQQMLEKKDAFPTSIDDEAKKELRRQAAQGGLGAESAKRVLGMFEQQEKGKKRRDN